VGKSFCAKSKEGESLISRTIVHPRRSERERERERERKKREKKVHFLWSQAINF
jgi:hypothetical protein